MYQFKPFSPVPCSNLAVALPTSLKGFVDSENNLSLILKVGQTLLSQHCLEANTAQNRFNVAPVFMPF
jgi:hypothetical protein